MDEGENKSTPMIYEYIPFVIWHYISSVHMGIIIAFERSQFASLLTVCFNRLLQGPTQQIS